MTNYYTGTEGWELGWYILWDRHFST